MRPLLIFSRWLTQRRNVVLPEPLGPISTTTSPLLTLMEMTRRTSLRWKYLCTSRASTMGRVPSATWEALLLAIFVLQSEDISVDVGDPCRASDDRADWCPPGRRALRPCGGGRRRRRS